MRPEILIPVLFTVVVVVSWTIATYNRFIKYKNKIEEAWSAIDVALKRRANLIPGLIRTIRAYSDHETNVFQAKTKALADDPGSVDRIEKEGNISRSIGGLLALAEAYPDLKANENFLDLQDSLDQIEREVQRARNRYNNLVGRFNILVESFPSSLIAKRFRFSKQNYLALELATQKEMPAVDFASGSTKENEREGP